MSKNYNRALAHHDMDLLINMPIGKRKYYVTNGKE